MKVNRLTKGARVVIRLINSHQREILLGCVIVGVISTGVTAWRNAPKARDIIEEHKKVMEEIPEDDKEARKQETFDTAKELAPLVLPPVVLGGLTIASAVGGHTASSKQIAALSAAYSIAEKSLSEYTEKAKEMLGEKKVQEIKDEVAIDSVKKAPPTEGGVFETGHGHILCKDSYSGRYFYSDPDFIKKVANKLDRQLRNDCYISLNEFYDYLGLEHIKLGRDLGFCVEDGEFDVEFSFFGATIGDKEDIPCCIVKYDVSPKYGYGDLGGYYNR